MAFRGRLIQGFTLIELMVTVTVIFVLLLIAVPSFESFRQRAATRAGAEQVLGFWNEARFQAAKRNSMVKVGVRTSGANFCLGAATTATAADTVACDCMTAGDCDVAAFPAPDTGFATQTEWRGVTFASTPGTAPTLGDAGHAVAVIEPKRTSLAASSQAGVLAFSGPSGSRNYRLNVLVDKFGRAAVCESTAAVDKLSDFANRRCAP